MLTLTHLSMFMPGQIMIFNSDLHHICPHLHSEANAQLSYLSSGQMSYLSLSQIPTNATNIIFVPHLDCICLTSNLFFRPVYRTRKPVKAEAISHSVVSNRVVCGLPYQFIYQMIRLNYEQPL